MKNEIIDSLIYKYEKLLFEDNKIEEIEILNDINIAFIQILKEDSKVLLGYTKTWELIRGVYNNRFNDLSKKKEEQAVMEFLL